MSATFPEAIVSSQLIERRGEAEVETVVLEVSQELLHRKQVVYGKGTTTSAFEKNACVFHRLNPIPATFVQI